MQSFIKNGPAVWLNKPYNTLTELWIYNKIHKPQCGNFANFPPNLSFSVKLIFKFCLYYLKQMAIFGVVG